MKKKTVLITGSSRGIGKAIALKYAAENFNVVINCVNNFDYLQDVSQEIKSIGGNVLEAFFDVSEYEEVEKMNTYIQNNFGDVDILINNAGISHVGLFHQMSPIEWKKVIDTNFLSVINCSNIFVKSMIEKKCGSIINISSIWGEVGASCEVIYSATKGAINSFSKALAKELGPSNIRVNSISCGVINTEMNNFLSDEEKNNLVYEIPLSRFGEGYEVADLCFYLSSDNSKYITGQVIRIDGGML